MNQLSELNKELVFHAPLDERNPIRDMVSLVNGTATDTYNVLDRQGSGRRWYEYNGSSSYTALPSIPAFGTGDFMVVMEVNIKELGRAQSFIGSQSFTLYINAANKIISGKNNTGDNVASATSITLGKHTIQYTRTGTSATYYIDGVADNTITDSRDYDTVLQWLGKLDNTYYFHGSISLVRIFNYALSVQQIANYSKPEYPIEWVDRGATGADVLSGWNFTNWNNGATTTIIDNNSYSGTGSHYLYKSGNPITTTKNYRIRFAGIVSSGTVTVKENNETTSYTTAQSGTFDYTGSFTCLNNVLVLRNSTTASTDITILSITQLGCILDLNAEGLGKSSYTAYDATKWSDFTNSLTATNSGTSLVVPSASCLGASFFNGTTSHLDLAGMNGLSGITTISAQIRPLALGGYLFTNTKVKLYLNASGYLTFSRDGSTYINSGAASIAINNTYDISITSTAAGVTNFYINNVLSGTANQAAGTPASGTSYIVGSNNTNFFTGTMKDLMINGEILDLDKIKLLNDTK